MKKTLAAVGAVVVLAAGMPAAHADQATTKYLTAYNGYVGIVNNQPLPDCETVVKPHLSAFGLAEGASFDEAKKALLSPRVVTAASYHAKAWFKVSEMKPADKAIYEKLSGALNRYVSAHSIVMLNNCGVIADSTEAKADAWLKVINGEGQAEARKLDEADKPAPRDPEPRRKDNGGSSLSSMFTGFSS